MTRPVAGALALLWPAADGLLSPAAITWYAQYGQDRYVYERFFIDTDHEQTAPRTFVELGASEGVELSNTLAFEEALGWRGLLLEPNEAAFQQLLKNRPRSVCVNDCVMGTPGLYEWSDGGKEGGLSMNSAVVAAAPDGATSGQRAGTTLRWCTTLPAVLRKHFGEGPLKVDFLSIDTEGSELEILSAWDFKEIPVSVITIEALDLDPSVDSGAARWARLQGAGFRFVDRLMADEIWVASDLINPLPSCLHPGVWIAGDRTDPLWALRESTRALYRRSWKLAEKSARKAVGAPIWKALSNFTLEMLDSVTQTKQWGERVEWCSPAFLVIMLAHRMLQGRLRDPVEMDAYGHAGPLHPGSLAKELNWHFVFHPEWRLKPLLDDYARGMEVDRRMSELACTEYKVMMPLGQSWFKASFVATLVGQWPLFGFLDLCSRLIISTGAIDVVVQRSNRQRVAVLKGPLPPSTPLDSIPPAGVLMPNPACHLLAGQEPGLVMAPEADPPQALSALLHHVDGCGLLGNAAVHFRRAAAFGDNPYDGREHWVVLQNWTAVCEDGDLPPLEKLARADSYAGEDPEASRPGTLSAVEELSRARCLEMGPRECAALSFDAASLHGVDNDFVLAMRDVRRVPRRCLGIVPQHGQLLHLRRRGAGISGPMRAHVEAGERLLREYIHRHGLLSAMIAGSLPPLVPTDSEPLFRTLQRLQDQLR